MQETLEDRGANDSIRLAADYDVPQIEAALAEMFKSFSDRNTDGDIAVIAQPLAGEGPSGHLSNERRLSKTENEWVWERHFPDVDQEGLNSWRDDIPDQDAPLATQLTSLVRTFGSVGRWVTSLQRGRAHLEWAYDGRVLWLVQIDFENEQPDHGVDPTRLLREGDYLQSGTMPAGSSFQLVTLSPAFPTPWRKVENVKKFAAVRTDPFPSLAAITGDRLQQAAAADRQKLQQDLDGFAHGRVVCRTDCRADGVDRENLPRTNTLSSAAAVDSMLFFLERMTTEGISATDICFLAHKFIPAEAGAWVRVDPQSSIVQVDALWGVPDGLQYLPHDTFEVDIRRGALSADRVRYKPRFIQECADGRWEELKVKRALARTRSLSAATAIEISQVSYDLSVRAGRPLLVMWFCGIPTELEIGVNLPWFSMPPNPALTLRPGPDFPRWPRKVLRKTTDVEAAFAAGAGRNILVLDPEVDLFRDTVFLKKVIALAQRDHCPVEIAGSTLAHAHYQLEKAGVTTVPADAPKRSRVRGRQKFAKLVRGGMFEQIASRGELVLQSRLQRSEMRRALVAKLLEEAHELLAASDPDEVKGELADLLEVVRAMANVTGVDWLEVEVAAREKRERRGGFEDGAILVGTEWPGAGRTAQKAPAMVTLESLGRIAISEVRSLASYNALLASGAPLKLEIGNRAIYAQLTREGLILHEADPAESSMPEQFELHLDDD